MATHGRLEKFEPEKDDWTIYIESLRYYFLANEVTTEAMKRSILLTCCGRGTLKLLRSLVDDPSTLDTTSYNDLVKLVGDYYKPKPSVIVQRYKFNTRVRKQGESVAAYVAALRELTEHCSYGTTLQEMLRDRLVCGVNHEGIQRKRRISRMRLL